jgi:nucleoside-diphosphate-sugar epimerase
MKVLVTGGAGYIGSMLAANLLEHGHRVRVLDNLSHGGQALLGIWSHPDFEFVRGDICDAETRRTSVAGMEAVVHLAAIVGDPACARQPELARAVNQDASLKLLAEAQGAQVGRFVFASTCSNYGKMADPAHYVDETSELRPVSLYAETKVAVEKTLLDPAQTRGICATALRFATVYGVSQRMRFDLTVNEFTLELLRHNRLQVFGEQFWRPYIHVRDVARAVTLILESPTAQVANEVFNVGATDQNYQKQGLVELLRPYAPSAVVEFVHRAEDPRDYRVSFEKINGALGFQITRTVADGIAEIAHLIRSQALVDFDNPAYRN